ncbi:hypothetical protein KKB64_05525 [Patescibacteria group bacterium]|nr:hypothetical protein [Patescibacteria group bacterium]MBU1473211.1 hypothetical protein [Patescibacteria group bacterium]MBU2459931.1 hypothetical protein [Patescibacteria group bacterium]MBU2544699.1 hypothetical protein [Patescibacteria group bacterium]
MMSIFGFLSDMSVSLNESVSVALVTDCFKKTVLPSLLYWRGRRLVIRKVGLHHTYRSGATLIHVFSVTDGANFYRLEFNTESLEWKLVEIDSNEI